MVLTVGDSLELVVEGKDPSEDKDIPAAESSVDKPSESSTKSEEETDARDIAEADNPADEDKEKSVDVGIGNADDKSADGETSKNQVDSATTLGESGEPQVEHEAAVPEKLAEESGKPQVEDEAAVPEKLADDVILPPLWKRAIFHVFPQLQKSEWQVGRCKAL